jgi:hypothetical protein
MLRPVIHWKKKSMNSKSSYQVAPYGWLPGLSDHRDHLNAAPVEIAGVFPINVDLHAQCSRFMIKHNPAVARRMRLQPRFSSVK